MEKSWPLIQIKTRPWIGQIERAPKPQFNTKQGLHHIHLGSNLILFLSLSFSHFPGGQPFSPSHLKWLGSSLKQIEYKDNNQNKSLGPLLPLLSQVIFMCKNA